MIVVGRKPHSRRCDLGLPASALPRIVVAAMLIRLFRNTRSVRRLRGAIETLAEVSARHVPSTVNGSHSGGKLMSTMDDGKMLRSTGRHEKGVMI